MMRILIATDAFRPQVNGVVRSLESLAAELAKLGVETEFLTPADFRCVPLPTYREISLALASAGDVAKRLERGYDHIHIATEGTIGLAARACCLRRKRVFTTSYHTRFPEYIEARMGVPPLLTYGLLRYFHNAGSGVMVSTASLAEELSQRGFKRLMRWSRGVDQSIFHPGAAIPIDLPRPIFLYAGRLAVEKNIEAFLSLDLPGSKLVAGDGPERARLEVRFPQAHFAGLKTSAELAALYSSADVFVFPSRTDTFGLAVLEALACGLPVAAFPVQGPADIIGVSKAGALDNDLRAAALAALDISRDLAHRHAMAFTWENCARQFLDNVQAARAGAPARSEVLWARGVPAE